MLPVNRLALTLWGLSLSNTSVTGPSVWKWLLVKLLMNYPDSLMLLSFIDGSSRSGKDVALRNPPAVTNNARVD